MIGTGIFTTTGLIVGFGAADGDVLLAWVIGGVVSLCGALCYGELGASLPHSGGEYHYLSRLIHPAVGFMSGCVSLVAGFAAPIAASAMAMHFYFRSIVPDWPVPIMAAFTIAILAALHAYDLGLGSRIQTSLVIVKVALIGAFIVGAFVSTGGPATTPQFTPSFWGTSASAVVLIFVYFAYSGWNAAAYIGSELKDPERVLPRSLLLGTLVVTAIYVLLNAAYLVSTPVASLVDVNEVGFVVAQTLWGDAAARAVAFLIAVTLVCPISAMILVGPRVIEAMAADGLLPAALARLNARKVPTLAVAFQAAVAVLVALTSSFGTLLVYIGFTLNIFAALTVVALIQLRRRGLSKHRICVGYPIPPIIYLAFAAWVTVWSIQSQPMATLAGLFTLGSSLALYQWMKRRSAS